MFCGPPNANPAERGGVVRGSTGASRPKMRDSHCGELFITSEGPPVVRPAVIPLGEGMMLRGLPGELPNYCTAGSVDRGTQQYRLPVVQASAVTAKRAFIS
jgi:hypothetical protein